MAALRDIAKEYADEFQTGVAWVIVWKTGRSWNAEAVWLDPDTEEMEPEDVEKAKKILEKDSNAVILNSYYCGHFGKGMTLKEIIGGIRWHYERNCNLLREALKEQEQPEADTEPEKRNLKAEGTNAAQSPLMLITSKGFMPPLRKTDNKETTRKAKAGPMNSGREPPNDGL